MYNIVGVKWRYLKGEGIVLTSPLLYLLTMLIASYSVMVKTNRVTVNQVVYTLMIVVPPLSKLLQLPFIILAYQSIHLQLSTE